MIDCESGAAISFLLLRAVELSDQGMERLTIRLIYVNSEQFGKLAQ